MYYSYYMYPTHYLKSLFGFKVKVYVKKAISLQNVHTNVGGAEYTKTIKNN